MMGCRLTCLHVNSLYLLMLKARRGQLEICSHALEFGIQDTSHFSDLFAGRIFLAALGQKPRVTQHRAGFTGSWESASGNKDLEHRGGWQAESQTYSHNLACSVNTFTTVFCLQLVANWCCYDLESVTGSSELSGKPPRFWGHRPQQRLFRKY